MVILLDCMLLHTVLSVTCNHILSCSCTGHIGCCHHCRSRCTITAVFGPEKILETVEMGRREFACFKLSYVRTYIDQMWLLYGGILGIDQP